MNDSLVATLMHLRALVACDTQNPPRAIGTDGIFDYLRSVLLDFRIELIDHGAGAVSMLAVRGTPDLLFNFHLDTVPRSPAWTHDPHNLHITDDRAIGLGACDIKGAAACMLAATARTKGDVALLFSSDEEANDARCIAAFLARDHGFTRVVVAEPTEAYAVLAHRGICSVLMRFQGNTGHASGERALHDSALHQAIRWGQRALDFVEAQQHARFGGLSGLRFNIGRIEGGIKANMIAPSAELRFGFRPLPSQGIDELLTAFHDFADSPGLIQFDALFRGPTLPAGDIAHAESRRLEARDLADELELPIGNAVDFWTEAALFSAAGLTALVYGPGNIAQAHTADEWVALDQLQRVTESYQRIIDHGCA